MAKKKKYSYGTSKRGIVRNYIPDPSEALYQDQINRAGAQADSMSNPWVMGMGAIGGMALNFGMQGLQGASLKDMGGLGKNALNNYFALGGMTGRPGMDEVEGGEMLQMPDGTNLEAKGPKHERGGIDIPLPDGTTIFSDRIKIDGKTMAQRKKGREKRVQTLTELIHKEPLNEIHKNTMKRVQSQNKREEANDLYMQQVVGAMMNPAHKQSRGGQGFALGGYKTNDPTDPYSILPWQLSGSNIPGAPGNASFGVFSSDINPAGQGDYRYDDTMYGTKIKNPLDNFNFGFPTLSKVNTPYAREEDLNRKINYSLPPDPHQAGVPEFRKKVDLTKSLIGDMPSGPTGDTPMSERLAGLMGNVSPGDIAGMAGNLYGMFKPMQNTNRNRSMDRVNKNMFEDFGQDALDTISESKQFLGMVRDNQMMDLETDAKAARNRQRNSARGVNTMRALDFMTDMGVEKGKRGVMNQYAANMTNQLNRQAQLENQRDLRVMSGADKADIANRRDMDQYYTNLAQNISTKSEAMQQIGLILNKGADSREAHMLIGKLRDQGILNERDIAALQRRLGFVDMFTEKPKTSNNGQ